MRYKTCAVMLNTDIKIEIISALQKGDSETAYMRLQLYFIISFLNKDVKKMNITI